MKTNLRPQEYYYLYSPFGSDPVDMLKYTFQGLCIDGHLEIFYKYIFINKNEKYPRKRLFLKFGPNYKDTNKYSHAETLLLSLFVKPELRLYEIRDLLMKQFDKEIKLFKSQYVYKDVCDLGLCNLRFFLSLAGRREKKNCGRLINEIDKNVDALLKNEKELDLKLDELGANVIFLEDDTLTKLHKNINGLIDLNGFFELDNDNFGDSCVSYGGYYGGSGGGYSGGGFSGFGGGSFGGAGSGGSW